MSMGSRLQEALDVRRRTPPDVIQAAKLSKGAVYNILNDATKPEKVRADTVTKICRFLGISRDWLVWGKGSMDAIESGSEPDWCDILGVQQAASLGPGAEPDEWAETHKLKFRADSLRRQRLRPDALAIIYGRGDSMEPTIKDGDAILFDTSDKELHDGHIYVIQYDNHLMAKRLINLADRWFIESDNKTDPQWARPKAVDTTRGFEIYGRVRWVGGWVK